MTKKILNLTFSSNQNQPKDKSDVYYFKLPHIINLLQHIKNKLSKLCKEFCKENFNIKFTVMEIEKALINDRLSDSKVS